jgi:PEP-CTERM motif
MVSKFVVFGLAVALAGPATAATFTAFTTLDLTQTNFAPSGFTGVDNNAFTPISGTLAAGDTFDYTIDFKGSQTLTLFNASTLWAFSYSGAPSSTVTGTGTLSFLDSSGNAFLTSSVKTSSENSVHFGQIFNSADFAGGLPATLTFYGVHYVGTLDSYGDPNVTSREYNRPALYFVADRNAIAVGVPEPASWALMIAGFGLTGAAMRRRRNRIVAA